MEKAHAKISLLGITEVDYGTLRSGMGVEARTGHGWLGLSGRPDPLPETDKKTSNLRFSETLAAKETGTVI